MIISPGRRYIFVHIPKTGGTSMARALEDRAMADDILIGDTPKAKRRKNRLKDLTPNGRLWKHSTLRDIEGILEIDQINKMFVFCLVRNPWDRLVSYYHWLQDQRFDHPAVKIAKTADFKSFLLNPMIFKPLQLMDAAAYVTFSSGQICETHFIRLENLAVDLQPLEDHLGFQLEIPQVNTSKRSRNFRDYYDTELRDHVAKICATDIKKFAYEY